MEWQTIPTGLLDILIAGLTKKYNLQYSGIVQTDLNEVGPASYYSKEQKTLVLVFKGNPLSEYAVIQDTVAPDVETADYAEKYGDILASFSDIDHVSFQKKAAGEAWDSIGSGFTRFYYIPNKGMNFMVHGTGLTWENEYYDTENMRLSKQFNIMTEDASHQLIYPRINITPILAVTPKKILPFFEVSENGYDNCQIGQVTITISNMAGNSQILTSTFNAYPSDVVTIPSVSKIDVTMTLNKTSESLDFNRSLAILYVLLET